MAYESIREIPLDWWEEHSGQSRVLNYDKVAGMIALVKQACNAPHSAARDATLADLETMLASPSGS